MALLVCPLLFQKEAETYLQQRLPQNPIYLYEKYWFWRTVVPSHASPSILQKTNTNTALEIRVERKNLSVMLADYFQMIMIL